MLDDFQKITYFCPFKGIFVSAVAICQTPLPPLSANVSQCQHLPDPPSPLCQPISLFNRPGVAGAVLQTLSSLTEAVSD